MYCLALLYEDFLRPFLNGLITLARARPAMTAAARRTGVLGVGIVMIGKLGRDGKLVGKAKEAVFANPEVICDWIAVEDSKLRK